LQKRPTKKTCIKKRDLQKRPADVGVRWPKGTVGAPIKTDLQNRPGKETYMKRRDLQKRPAKETCRCRCKMGKECCWCTYETDLQKRPTSRKETCKRDLQMSRPAKET